MMARIAKQNIMDMFYRIAILALALCLGDFVFFRDSIAPFPGKTAV
jgi:hypothetical protein